MPKARIKDVAKHARVSEATITRVVNNNGYVAEETRKRVEKSIEVLEYIPNRMARALKNSRSGIIGNVHHLVVNDPFFSSIAMGLKNAAQEYDYQILPIYDDETGGFEERLLRIVTSGIIEGLILSGTVKRLPKTIRLILNKQIPVIMLERTYDISGVDKVLIDDFGGSSAAAEKFIALGHKNLGYIGKELDAGSVEIDRFNGFFTTLKKNNIKLRESNIIFTQEYLAEYGYEAIKQIFSKNKNRPTACFFGSDILACGALQYLYETGIRIPDDISIIGNNNTLSALCSPPITSVAIPHDEIGVTAISLFRERQEQNRKTDKTVKLKLSIMDRGSVKDLCKS